MYMHFLKIVHPCPLAWNSFSASSTARLALSSSSCASPWHSRRRASSSWACASLVRAVAAGDNQQIVRWGYAGNSLFSSALA